MPVNYEMDGVLYWGRAPKRYRFYESLHRVFFNDLEPCSIELNSKIPGTTFTGDSTPEIVPGFCDVARRMPADCMVTYSGGGDFNWLNFYLVIGCELFSAPNGIAMLTMAGDLAAGDGIGVVYDVGSDLIALYILDGWSYSLGLAGSLAGVAGMLEVVAEDGVVTIKYNDEVVAGPTDIGDNLDFTTSNNSSAISCSSNHPQFAALQNDLSACYYQLGVREFE